MGNNFIINESFQLVRTNPKLTTNIQIVVDSNYSIYLESFNTNKQLSDDKYKHFSISKETFYEDKVSEFYDNLPINIAFDVKNDKDNEIMYNKYQYQFDDIYWAGARKVKDNIFYEEEFSYLAPLYIKNHKIPSNFVILRVDNPGIYEVSDDDFSISSTNKSNFRTEIIDKWKCVSVYDMTIKSEFGYWIENNFTNNVRYPMSPLEFDSKEYNFTRWYGIDYFTGVYTDKGMYLDDKLWYENPHFKFEEFLTNSYKDNELIFPHILNFKFLFDDTPATPFQLNKYSLNRYFGFYADFEKVKTVTPYRQTSLIDGLKIEKNIFMLSGQTSGSTMPFQIDSWSDEKIYYVFAIDNLYKVIRVLENGLYYYKIISEHDLTIDDVNRNNEVDIRFTSDANNNYTNKIEPRINTNFQIDEVISSEGVDTLYADLYLIKIDDKYHVLEKNTNELGQIEYYIRSDYGIRTNVTTVQYWILDETSALNSFVLIEDTVNEETPIIFDIYRVKFYDIKDFDFNRVDTHFADYDLNKSDEYVETPELKLYTIEHRDSSESEVYKTYDENNINVDKIIISSSEYVSSDELYEITEFGLSPIWSKNQYVAKWGYVGSNSHSDYPYKLNNSQKVGDVYNRTTDINSNLPDIVTKTHAYFYRIGEFFSTDSTSTYNTNVYYDVQTLSIQTATMASDSQTFNLDYYLDSDVDYFDYFFSNTRYFNSSLNKEQTAHYSVFNNGSKYNISSTLFKGIRYNIYRVTDIIRDESKTTLSDGKIKKVLIDKNINFNNYKFSVIANINNTGSTSIYTTKLNLDNNGIHVFLNDKYENVLVLINIVANFNDIQNTFNNVNHFNQIESLYTGKDYSGNTYYDPILLTAQNFISSLNDPNDKGLFDNYVNYYYVDSDAQSGFTTINPGVTGNLRNISSWVNDFPPFILECDFPNEIKMKIDSFTVAAIKGPKYNIYDKYKTDYNEVIYDKDFIKEPLARYIKVNEKEIKPKPIEHGETLSYDKSIYRYNGPYEPIFKNIELFKNSDYYLVNGAFFEQARCGGYYDESISSLQGDLTDLTVSQLETLINFADTQITYYTNLMIFLSAKITQINSDIQYYTNIVPDLEYVEKLQSDLAYYTAKYNSAEYNKDLWTTKKAEYESLTLSAPVTGLESTPWIFKDKILGLCDGNYASCEVLVDAIEASNYTNVLIVSKFAFSIPPSAIINGITVNIKKRAELPVTKSLSTTYIWVVDEEVSLVKPDGTKSDNKAKLPVSGSTLNVGDFDTYWNYDSTNYVYGGSNDLWGLTGTSVLDYTDLNSDFFALSIQAKVYNRSGIDLINIAYIDCICITIDYTIDGVTTGYTYSSNFSKNLIFDTSLYYFGETEEIIYSKVNEDENVLKIKQTEEDKSIYPMVDEFGYSYTNRFIFKSSWDSDYYIKTKNEIE